ncbi:MAG: S8 family serine peptidase [Acidimicrobiia bacterium]
MDHGGQRGLAVSACIAVAAFLATAVAAIHVRPNTHGGAPTAQTGFDDPGDTSTELVVHVTDPAVRAQVEQAAVDAGGEPVARIDHALDAVVVRAAPVTVPAVEKAVAAVRAVSAVQRVPMYKVHSSGADLAAMNDALGAAAAHAAGVDGSGTRIAVIDSGVDYTHAALGGTGSAADFATCAAQRTSTPTGTCATLFGPTASKVTGGFDFVGDQWPNGPIAPDPNPIDLQGHGTHVADIAAGNGPDGHLGMAPGAKILALKACSSVSGACSGTALLQAMDRALDPNGDGKTDDHVDVINLSLGTAYGSTVDPLAAAVEKAVAFGVIVVASAGNSGDQPFILASPASTPAALAVGQTTVPSEALYPLTGPAIGTVNDSVYQAWSPAPTALTGNVAAAAGDGSGCNRADYTVDAQSPIALARRGTCDISTKANAAAQAGAKAIVIANNAPGEAPSYGATAQVTIPVLSIAQGDGDRMFAVARTGSLALQLDPSRRVSLGTAMANSSARGPSIQGKAKPDVTAPGAWWSATSGTGTGSSVFSGTSGSAPVVAGVAALLRGQYPTADVQEIKAIIVETSAPVGAVDATGRRTPAPIGWAGSGEVRVGEALDTTANLILNGGDSSWMMETPRISTTFTDNVNGWFNNRDGKPHTYTVTPTFRDQADQALGAVSFDFARTFSLPAFSGREFNLSATIDAAKLPAWPLGGRAGSTGNDGTILEGPEIDGHIVIARDDGAVIRIPWYVLPHRAIDLQVPDSISIGAGGTGSVAITNRSAIGGKVDVYNLVGTSPVIPANSTARGTPGSGRELVDLAAVGVRDDGTTISFAVASQKRYLTPNAPAAYQVVLDVNGDGNDDLIVYNAEPGADPYTGSGFGTDGRNVVYTKPIGGAATPAGFETESDYGGQVVVLTVRLSTIGAQPGQRIRFRVDAIDAQYTGELTDSIGDNSYVVGRPSYRINDARSLLVGANTTTTYTVTRTAGSETFDDRTGLLLVNHDGFVNDYAPIVGRAG